MRYLCKYEIYEYLYTNILFYMVAHNMNNTHNNNSQIYLFLLPIMILSYLYIFLNKFLSN